MHGYFKWHEPDTPFVAWTTKSSEDSIISRHNTLVRACRSMVRFIAGPVTNKHLLNVIFIFIIINVNLLFNDIRMPVRVSGLCFVNINATC